LLRLSPESEKELEAFSARLRPGDAKSLKRSIERVCADPSGMREPRHHFTRRFVDYETYTGKRLPRDIKVYEFRPPGFRGLYIIDRPYMIFLKVRGRRFRTADDCPWH
jgi:hypothetical protein